MTIADFTYTAELRLPGSRGETYYYFSLPQYAAQKGFQLSRLPYSVRMLLENLLRGHGRGLIPEQALTALISRDLEGAPEISIPWYPCRVIMQDYSGLPALVDLAALRDVAHSMGQRPERINPAVPVHLVIDHSHQSEHHGAPSSFLRNLEQEYRGNQERYIFFKWAGRYFKNLDISPPGSGIIHQINLESLTALATVSHSDGRRWIYPDSLLGMDSHTTMINGAGVLGWGVGGLEAESVILGEPAYIKVPRVIGVRLEGRRPAGVTATDTALALTRRLREENVVECFIEFFGPGLENMPVPDRAVIANMAPEYGATMGYFPVDRHVAEYLESTGRGDGVSLVDAYFKAQNLFRVRHDEIPPEYHRVIEFDMNTLQRFISGPSRPWELKKPGELIETGKPGIQDQCVALAAITSCTNTANPELLAGAGLLARAAVLRGLTVPGYVKTIFAPGAPTSFRFLQQAGLMPFLEKLGFYNTGYGCSACLGASGPLHPDIERAIGEKNLSVRAVLSGNRNFEARIHPLIRENYLASPALVVAYALAGRMSIDFSHEPLGTDDSGKPVFLADVWPEDGDLKNTVREFATPELFRQYTGIPESAKKFWRDLPEPEGMLWPWSRDSSYIKKPPLPEIPEDDRAAWEIVSARALAVLGDSVTTDHISPVGLIPALSPAGLHLSRLKAAQEDFNTYGARRGNHEIMVRGTFAHGRLCNKLTAPRLGGITLKLPENREMSVFDAAEAYNQEKTPMIILAGRHYGTGSARDWAARGAALLGVRAVIAQSFERIHRSNLIQMGVLPLQFLHDASPESLGLTGRESFSLIPRENPGPNCIYIITATADQGENVGQTISFTVQARLDTPTETMIFRNRGFLSAFLKSLDK